MPTDSELRDTLLKKRKVSDNGNVTYDLASDVDFSEPVDMGSILSDIVMENDVSNWISVNNDGMVLKPTYSVKVVVAENENEEIEQAVETFFDRLGSGDGLLSVAKGVNLGDEKRPPTVPLLLIGTFMISMFAILLLQLVLGIVMLVVFIIVVAAFDFFAARYLNAQRDYDHTSELLAILLNYVEVKALDSV